MHACVPIYKALSHHISTKIINFIFFVFLLVQHESMNLSGLMFVV